VPVFKTNYGINEKVMTEGVLPIVDAVVKELKVPVIDLHEALKDSDKDFHDGVHPDGNGQGKMAKAIAKEITSKDR
jgi:lysophospholipase L1-like esterase